VTTNQVWQAIYLDDFLVIYTTDKIITQKGLLPLNPASLSPSDYSNQDSLYYLNIALFLINTGHPDRGVLFAQKALSINQQSKLARTILSGLTP
jgi:hypothetical protein